MRLRILGKFLPVLAAVAVWVVPAMSHGLICRTPGFWGTHAGTEKNGSQNITQAVINAAGGALPNVCGSIVTNTNLNNIYSAVENMCVAPAGEQYLQLKRQLTAMALNCQLSGGGNDCSQLPNSGVTTGLSALYASCSSTCAANSDKDQITSCINQIDCFNNGGVWDSSRKACLAVENGCKQAPLCDPAQNLCFEPPGPAGSSDACNAAKD